MDHWVRQLNDYVLTKCEIINDYSDAVKNHHEVRSSEEMRAAFDAYNKNTDPTSKKKSRILSMDAVGLYPSMTKKNSIIAVKEMIHESDLKLQNFNWWEAAKYIYVIYDSETIEAESLSSHAYTVGDDIFLQEDGGPIGLELTGALSRPFMRRWDKL